MNDAYHYVGDELDLFAAARRWKAYFPPADRSVPGQRGS